MAASGATTPALTASPTYCGLLPESAKNTVPDADTDVISIAQLNTPCARLNPRRIERKPRSSVSATAPASAPNCSTHANAKSSDNESLDSIEGTLSVRQPAAIVRHGKRSHALGTSVYTSTKPQRITTAAPRSATAPRNAFVRSVTYWPPPVQADPHTT